MKKRSMILAVLAVSLILAGSIGSAFAYFTTYVEAEGGYTITLEEETTIEEEFFAWMKRVVIELTEGSEPVYVRVRAYSGDAYPLTYWYEDGDQEYPLPSENSKWIQKEDGFYYYSDILSYDEQKGETGKTLPLLVKIENAPTDAQTPPFDVVVVYETLPVQYKEDGTLYRADEIDWKNAKKSIDVVEGGTGQ